MEVHPIWEGQVQNVLKITGEIDRSSNAYCNICTSHILTSHKCSALLEVLLAVIATHNAIHRVC